MNLNILMKILNSVDTSLDSPLQKTVIGAHMVAVAGKRCGMASRTLAHPQKEYPPLPEASVMPKTLLGLAEYLAVPTSDLPHPEMRSLAIAAANALLPPPHEATNMKGQDILSLYARDKRVAVIGHFPFVEKMAEAPGMFSAFSVLEINPRPGDLPAEKAAEVLPEADFIAITGTTLLNDTLENLLSLCRKEAHVMLLGPTAPFSSALFEAGVDTIAGAVIDDFDQAATGIESDLPFKAVPGTRGLVWRKSQKNSTF